MKDLFSWMTASHGVYSIVCFTPALTGKIVQSSQVTACIFVHSAVNIDWPTQWLKYSFKIVIFVKIFQIILFCYSQLNFRLINYLWLSCFWWSFLFVRDLWCVKRHLSSEKFKYIQGIFFASSFLRRKVISNEEFSCTDWKQLLCQCLRLCVYEWTATFKGRKSFLFASHTVFLYF